MMSTSFGVLKLLYRLPNYQRQTLDFDRLDSLSRESNGYIRHHEL